MSVIGSNILAGASGQAGYNLTKSLRFRSSASAYLNRTPASATNRQTWTLSAWVKRGILSATQFLFDATAGVGTRLYFTSSDVLQFDTGGSGVFTTTQVFRDPSAWYHIVFVADTTQATASNRIKLYINGTQITAFSATSYPAQNTNMDWNNNVGHYFGRNGNASVSYLDGYLAEINNIDGQALTPSSFGETSTTTGVWIPKKYTGSYGTNGFYLKFTDTTSTSTLGTDFSGNSNTWTVNNISLTSGSTYDSMTDVPTLTSATTANYCVLNAASIGADATLSDANLTIAYGSAATRNATMGTLGLSSGKWYWEYTIVAASVGGPVLGITNTASASAVSNYPGFAANGWGYAADGSKYNNGTGTAYGATYATNDIIGVAFDADTGSITFYKNNTSQGVAFSSLAAGTYFPAFGDGSGTGTLTGAVNFGQRPFAYTPPTGFVALNTFNLPTPTIGATAATTANEYFDATIWTGDNTTPRSITNSGSMQPDFVWIKSRSNAYQNNLYDSVRGAGAAYALSSDQTAAEGGNSNVYGYLSAFNSTGFQVTQGTAGSGGAPNGNAYTNQTSTTYVAWQWRASNATAVTNTAGSITSTVSANTTAGFSIVTYTGNGTSGATVGHGLGVAPSMIIVKNRSATWGWFVYNRFLTNPNTGRLQLNLTNAEIAGGTPGPWNNTAPTSTVFSLGDSSFPEVNGSGNLIVAYCFAPIAGYSAFGSYTGNGSTDGTFVFTGFRPRFVMFKNASAASQWILLDTSRNTYNVANAYLEPNTSDAENTASNVCDILSNGFKIRTTGTDFNDSSNTYIYACFAENPFKYANAR